MREYINELDLHAILMESGVDPSGIGCEADVGAAAQAVVDKVVFRLREQIKQNAFKRLSDEIPRVDQVRLLKDCAGNALRAIRRNDVTLLLMERIREEYLPLSG